MDKKILHIVIVLYAIINAIFVDKYSARIIEWHTILSFVYMLGICALSITLPRIVQKLKHPHYWLLGISISFLGLGIAIQYNVDPLTIQVDRWSAIHNFLEGMLQGIYPYGQQTHLGGYGSPLPVWQLVHLPFYVMGNVGLSIFAVIGLFIYTINKTRGMQVALAATLLLILSPTCWYEIAVRSDLITNILLVTIIVEWLMYYQISLSKRTVSLAILSGLLLSTRLVAVIPLAVIYGYEFLTMGWKKQSIFLGISLLTFGLTLVPFLLWEGSTLFFFEYNPFVLQTRQGSGYSLLIFTAIAVSITLYMKEDRRMRLTITGGLLTCLVTIAFFEKMWAENLWNELFSPTFDITYLSMALPFYLVEIASSCKKSKLTSAN